jgi:transcriptional regulator with XRE-family HTH domain
MRLVFTSPWTPEKIWTFRETYNLTQTNLAALLRTKQQRISEWEMGIHGMKGKYSIRFDVLDWELAALHSQADHNQLKFNVLIKEKYGVVIYEEPIYSYPDAIE